MVTIYDIAKKTGYSSTTVSKALNDYPDISIKTKEIIRNASKEMGYTVNITAKSLKTKKSNVVGILVEKHLELGPHYNKIIDNFRQEMERLKYDIMFVSEEINGMSYKEHCQYRSLDGVFIVLANMENMDTGLRELIESDIPTVTIDSIEKNISSVNSENAQGIELAVEYLKKLGHKNIGYFGGNKETLSGLERFRGFKNGIMNQSLKLVDEWVIFGNKFNFDMGYKAFNKLMEFETKPTAIVTASDLIAFGTISAMVENGYKVPEDFSIIGFDNTELSSYYNPKLTTIAQDYNLIGSTVANHLVKLIKNESYNIDIRIPTNLIERSSCRKL